MKTTHLRKISYILFLIGYAVLYAVLFVPQSEELNLSHIFLAVSSTVLLMASLLLMYLKRYQLSTVDAVTIIAYLYFIVCNRGLSNFSETYTVSLFINIYLANRVVFKYFEPKHVLVCLLSIFTIYQSVIGIGQFYGQLESRHTLFPVTGTFLNPGPFGSIFAVIGVSQALYINSYYRLFKVCCKSDSLNDKKSLLFRFTYCIGVVTLSLCVSMIVLSKSRSALLGFIIPIMMFFLSAKRIKMYKSRIKYRKALAFVGILILTILMLMIYNVRSESANGRLHIWKVSLSEPDKSLILGTGFGTFPRQYAIKQEEFYTKQGVDSNWIKYADTPFYAFNEYLHIVYEIGVIGLFLFCLISFLVIKQQLSHIGCKIFAYGVISTLIISFTSYPLHIIPILIVFVTFVSINKGTKKQQISHKLSLLTFTLIFLFTVSLLPHYAKTINATKKWSADKRYSEMSTIELRKESDFIILYEYLKDNDKFMLDYGIFLKKKKEYTKSINILEKGHIISNNPYFPLLLADVYADIGIWGNAELYYKKAFMMLPNRLTPLYQLGVFYFETKQYEKFNVLADFIINFHPKIPSEHTDKMKKDISDLLNILYECQPI